jgi:hypothetical protein
MHPHIHVKLLLQLLLYESLYYVRNTLLNILVDYAELPYQNNVNMEKLLTAHSSFERLTGGSFLFRSSHRLLFCSDVSL